MSTQYDTIQAPYDHIRKKSIALIEHENVRTTLAPYIANARVLELACGSGFYTYSFLHWGATSVHGIDISPTMITEAKRLAPQDLKEGSIAFTLADCSIPTTYPGGPFDVVFGAWLLNYAPDRAALVSMFTNIALNLRLGGHFVSVTVPPTNDPTASVEAEFRARPPPEGSGGLSYYKLRDVEDGIYFHVHGWTPVGEVRFECWHLRREVYESAVREAGLRVVGWGGTCVPEGWLKGEGEGEVEGGASREELGSYEGVPGYGVLVVEK